MLKHEGRRRLHHGLLAGSLGSNDAPGLEAVSRQPT
jgi:hypothetical protein